jgi:hypothetical protein
MKHVRHLETTFDDCLQIFLHSGCRQDALRKAPAAAATAAAPATAPAAAAAAAAAANHIIPVPAKRGRPRRNAGRSLSERNPDFVDVPRSPSSVGTESPNEKAKGVYFRVLCLQSIIGVEIKKIVIE